MKKKALRITMITPIQKIMNPGLGARPVPSFSRNPSYVM